MWLRKLIIYCLFLLGCLGKGQIIVADHYSSESGLDSNEILKIFQDSRKMLWVTTRYGTYVKDMNYFRRIDRFNEIQFSNVRDIIEDQNHNMWFASYGHGVVFFNGAKTHLFSEKDGLITNRFQKLYAFKGRIYVGGLNGVSSFNPQTLQHKNHPLKKTNSSPIEVNSFVEMNGQLYITTINDGIFRVDDDGLSAYSSFKPIVSSFGYKDEVIFSSNNGLTVFNHDQLIKNNILFRDKNFPVIWNYTSIKYPKNIWLITSNLVSGTGQIFKFNGREFKDITQLVGISSDFPRGIVYDKFNNVVYISTLDNGLYRILLDVPFQFYPLNHSAVINLVSIPEKDYLLTSTALYIQTNHHTKKVIYGNDFYDYFQKHKNKFRKKIERDDTFFPIDFNQKPNNIKLYDLKQFRNHIWIGSNIGIFRMDLEGNINYYLPIHGFKFSVTEDALIDLNPYREVKVVHNLEEMDYTILSKKDPNCPTNIVSTSRYARTLYFASSLEGLFKYEKGKFLSYLQAGEFLESKLKIVKTIANNRILVATEAGDIYILKVKGDRLIEERKVTHKQIDQVNITLLNEINGCLIIGTNKNIIIISGDQFYYIDKEHGFKHNNFYYSSIQNNRLLVGTDEGYYSLNIKKIVGYVSQKPKINISGITINNVKFGRDKFYWFDLIDKKLKLKSHENNIAIDFILSNPKYSNKYKYRYRLNPGLPWSEYFDQESINFTSLRYGKYNLELEITDLTGNIKTVLPFLQIDIEPPFYLNIYFILGNIAGIGLFLFLLYRRKIRHLKVINKLKINQLIEKNNAEQQRISLEKKLSEVRLMALQSQMNPHFIFNILNSIQYYIIDNDVENALEGLGRFATLIRKMLDLSSKTTISLIEEINFLEMYVQVENYRYKNKIDFIVYTPSEINLYNITFPPMLLQPLIENSIVHGFDMSKESNTITIRIEKESNFLNVIIQDNGKGLTNIHPSTKFHESKGLNIIRERLKLFNQIDKDFIQLSNESPGTRVVVKIKLL